MQPSNIYLCSEFFLSSFSHFELRVKTQYRVCVLLWFEFVCHRIYLVDDAINWYWFDHCSLYMIHSMNVYSDFSIIRSPVSFNFFDFPPIVHQFHHFFYQFKCKFIALKCVILWNSNEIIYLFITRHSTNIHFQHHFAFFRFDSFFRFQVKIIN